MKRNEAITTRESHAAINVKVYRLTTPEGYTDSDSERAWDMTVEEFWDDATQLAHERGYAGVFSEGRSGGWCVPYDWSKAGVQHTHNYSQGPTAGYPVYPDVEHNCAAREKFRAFEREIRRLLAQTQTRYISNLIQVREVSAVADRPSET